MKAYATIASKDQDGFWEVFIPELGGLTQALSEDEIERSAQDFIALTLGTDEYVEVLIYVEESFSVFEKLLKGEVELARA